jgi:hypothetical protein
MIPTMEGAKRRPKRRKDPGPDRAVWCPRTHRRHQWVKAANRPGWVCRDCGRFVRRRLLVEQPDAVARTRLSSLHRLEHLRREGYYSGRRTPMDKGPVWWFRPYLFRYDGMKVALGLRVAARWEWLLHIGPWWRSWAKAQRAGTGE